MSKENIVVTKKEVEEIEIVEEEEEDEEEQIVEKTQEDFRVAIRDVASEVLSYSMIEPTKRKEFSDEIKKNKTCQEYIDEQLYLKYLQTQNQHIKFGIVFSYLYIKTLNHL